MEAVGRASPFTRTYLLEAHPVSFQKNVFTIGFDPEFEDHLGLVDNARNHTLLQTKLLELGHPNAQIKFIKAAAPEKRAAAPAQAGSPAGSRARTQRRAKALCCGQADSRGARTRQREARPGAFQQGRLQERSPDPEGPGDLQRPDRRSPRLTPINPRLHHLPTLNPQPLTLQQCPALANS